MEFTEKYHKINLAMSVERTYTSFMRNCIILFTLGLTIINLTKRRKTEKFMLSFIIIISGIVMGIISTKEFYDRVKLIEDGNYKDYKLLTKTIGIYGFIIFVFIVILCYKFINMNDEHNIIKFNKSKK